VSGRPYPTGGEKVPSSGPWASSILRAMEEMAMKFGSQINHDRKILSHIKWASALIFKHSRDIEKRFRNVCNVMDLITRKPLTTDNRPIKYYRFEYPLGKREEDGITTKISHEVRIWSEKGIELIEKPGRVSFLGGDIKITVDGRAQSNEEYFVLTIIDRSRRLLKTLDGSKNCLFSEPYSYYETPSIKILLRERPLKDSRERKAKTGKEKIYPIKGYISSFRRRTGLIPIMIPKSLKEERWTRVGRGTPEIAFFREKPQRKRLHDPLEKEEKPRWVLGDHSYSPLDYSLQIAVYSLQANLLTNVDCLLRDFGKYVSAKNRKPGPKDNSVKTVGYYYDEYTDPNTGKEYSAHISYNAPEPKKSKWSIDLKKVNSDVLMKGLQYIVNSYYLPYNPTSFEVYSKKTISGILKAPFRKPYEPKINPDKDMRKEIIRLRMEKKGCSFEAARKWVYRKQIEDWSLYEIYGKI
jgi:hypothetical protein